MAAVLNAATDYVINCWMVGLRAVVAEVITKLPDKLINAAPGDPNRQCFPARRSTIGDAVPN